MSTRYNDRDYDRERQNYGRRPTRDYDRSYGERSRYYRYDDSDLENERFGRESEYDSYSSPTRRQYQTREGYGGEAFGTGRYNQSSDSNRSYPDVERYGRSYDDDWQNRKTWSRESQRYNYPSGYRTGSSYREYSGYGDYGRGEYQEGDRGWWDRTSDEVASWFGDEEAQQRRRMDRRREQFRGRGPKGYRRSDERIREDVNDRLSDDNYLDASDIEVAVSETLVTLTGTVRTRIDKRRAEDIAESVSGVTNVENRLRVKESSLDRTSGIGTTGTTATSMTDTASRSRTAGT
jgi:osmotically-inducible protein OsmY